MSALAWHILTLRSLYATLSWKNGWSWWIIEKWGTHRRHPRQSFPTHNCPFSASYLLTPPSQRRPAADVRPHGWTKWTQQKREIFSLLAASSSSSEKNSQPPTTKWKTTPFFFLINENNTISLHKPNQIIYGTRFIQPTCCTWGHGNWHALFLNLLVSIFFLSLWSFQRKPGINKA